MGKAATGVVGVVVLYRPDASVAGNIRSYLEDVDLLVIVDNSPMENPGLGRLGGPGKSLYMWDGINRGLPFALNRGAEAALAAGGKWLLTMDQDSRFRDGAVARMLKSASGRESVGILSPRHVLDGDGAHPQEGMTEIKVAMTSGNLLSLDAYRKTGGFLEKLFIDYVDYEYCLRLRKNGFRNFRVNDAELIHSLGNIRIVRLFSRVFRPTNHDARRRYYMTRNRLYVMSRYPAHIPAEMFAWAKEMAKLLLFEKERRPKLLSMAKGFLHFLRGRYGPLDQGPSAIGP